MDSVPQQSSQTDIKLCPRCQSWKTFDAFAKCANRKDGLQAECRDCRSERGREYRERTAELQKERHKRYYEANLESIRQKHCEYQRLRWREDPEHMREISRRHYYKNDGAKLMREWRAANRDHENTLKRARYAANPERHRAYARATYHKYPERAQARFLAWSQANREYRLAYYRKRYQTKRDKYLTYAREWRTRLGQDALREFYRKHNHLRYQRNPEKVLEYQQRRHARKKNAPRVENINLPFILHRDKSTCYLCNRQLTRKQVTLDHVVPLTRGGDHTHDNLRVACRSCNSRKNNRLLKELDWYNPF